MVTGSRSKHVLRVPLMVVAGVLILVDEVARPLYRPIARAFGRLHAVEATEAMVASLPPYGILVCLLVPFGLAEPLKVLALIIIGQGHLATGAGMLALAYLASFLIVDRIYHAGRAKLLSIGWFAVIIGWLVAVRRAILHPILQSHIYRTAIRSVRRLRQLVRRPG